jgi:hypothetical protein
MRLLYFHQKNILRNINVNNADDKCDGLIKVKRKLSQKIQRYDEKI